jgi:hypothetical protein
MIAAHVKSDAPITLGLRELATVLGVTVSILTTSPAGAQWAVAPSPTVGAICNLSAPDIQAYNVYLAEKTCSSTLTNKCLEQTSYVATRSDGRRVNVGGVYRWRESDGVHYDTWADDHQPGVVKKRVLVHFILAYMKKLRDAYATCPGAYFTQAYNQVDFVVSDAVVHGGALVWENRLGIAQAMEQADMALIFMQMAKLYRDKGQTNTARGTMGYALRAARAFFVPVGVHTGGVRSVNQDACAAKTARLRPCFWFHSRGRGVDTAMSGEPLVNTVLNEFLHVLRDLIPMSVLARDLDDLIPADLPPPHYDFRTWLTWGDLLEDRAVGGLYQLAFSAGHKGVAPTRPPNLAQFMDFNVRPEYGYLFSPLISFYSSYYAFDLLTGLARNISHKKTCHYHAHTLNLFGDIWTSLRRPSIAAALAASDDGWRIGEAMHRLFEGRGEQVGVRPSRNAVYQFYRAEEPYYRFDVWQCPVEQDGFTPDTLLPGNRAIYEEFFGPW